MSAEFPIIPILAEKRDEQLGTKRKFWCEDDQGHQWLFKFIRPDTGEDWAEKLGAEIAGLLGLPHATVELADYFGERGALSLDLTDHQTRGALVLGNSLLSERDPSYPAQKADYFRLSEHTVDKVVTALSQPFIFLPLEFRPNPDAFDAVGLFIGYLLLDAFIGNQDRHHENWAIIEHLNKAERDAELCPTFDHASSFGHNLSDEERNKRLTSRDRGYNVAAFSKRARSALFLRADDKRPLTTIAAFVEAGRSRPAAAKFWIERIRLITEAQIDDLLRRIPNSRMSQLTKDFTHALLVCNRDNLLSVGL